MLKFRLKQYSKVLNTSIFDKTRNYDQDLNSRELNKNLLELRRTNDLNLNKELSKVKLDARKEFKGDQINNELRKETMGKIVLKRKTYGMLGEVGRGLLNTGGKILDSGVGKVAGAIGGAKFLGSAIGTLLGVGPVLGGIGGAIIGSKAAKGLGQGLQNASYS